MGRSGDHLVADCYLGQHSPYLNISRLKPPPRLVSLKTKSSPKTNKQKKSQEAHEEETLVR